MDFVLQFFNALPGKIEYAIERGLDHVQHAAKGDLDVVIRKKDFPAVHEAAARAGLLVSSSITYGGARIFLGNQQGELKRIDFDWLIHYRGLPLHRAEHYLGARQKDSATGLYVLPDGQHADIIYFIKNCYGGAQKYRALLESHGRRVLTNGQRLGLIFGIIARHPFKTLLGKMRYLGCYMFRLSFPTGLVISGVSSEAVNSLPDIKYLFQGRVFFCGNLKALLGARFLSQLCVVPNSRFADLDLSNSEDPECLARQITAYLRRKRVFAPRTLFTIA